MRTLALLVVLAVGANSFASYELMMVFDRAAGKIRRFDPNTGLNLGSFGQGLDGTNYNLLLDQSSGEVVVANNYGSYAQVYNYNTGSYVSDRNFFYGTSRASANSGFVATAHSDPNYVITSTVGGAYQGFKFLSGASFSMMAATSNSRVYAVDSNAGKLTYWTSASAVPTGNITIPSFGNYFFVGAMALSSTRLAFSSSTASVSSPTLWFGDLDTNGVPTLRSFNLSSRYTIATQCVFGHNDDVYVATRKADGLGYVARYNYVTGAWRGEFAAGTSDIAGLAMVVAPEPTSMLALAGGLAWLMRRRTVRNHRSA